MRRLIVNFAREASRVLAVVGFRLSFKRIKKSDEVVQEILRYHGYEVYPIDCSDIILTNSAIHCISKTAPKMKIGPQT
jgi:predicted CoA-binding protein